MTPPSSAASPEAVQTISDYLNSPTEKIHLVIGTNEVDLYRFLADTQARAAQAGHTIFRYEFWPEEQYSHFLFRWLRETAFGQAFKGPAEWEDWVTAHSGLQHKLELLVERDIRPLDIRFIEAVRFISQKIEPGRQAVLCFTPRTSLTDHVLVEFFQALLRIIPVGVKVILGQLEGDYPGRQADFCPSNRLHLNGIDQTVSGQVQSGYQNMYHSQGLPGDILDQLGQLPFPASIALLSELHETSSESVEDVLRDAVRDDLIEENPSDYFRLAYPRSFTAAIAPGSEVDRDNAQKAPENLQRATEFIEARLKDGRAAYPDALHHSLALFNLTADAALGTRILDSLDAKVAMGFGEICELELGHALQCFEGHPPHPLQGRLLLKLGEIREARQRNREALEVLTPATEILNQTGPPEKHHYALELKGRAAFALRESDTALAAFDEACHVAQGMEREDLVADIWSQIGYLHFSSKRLDDAETYYSKALAYYQQEDLHDGRGEAAQLANLGHTYYARGDMQRAEMYHREAKSRYEDIDDILAVANQWGYIGHTYFAAQDFTKAVEAYEKAADLETAQGEPEKAAQRHANVGHSMYARRDTALAVRSFEKALAIYRELGNPEGEAAQLSNLGLVYGDQGEYEPALENFKKAGDMYTELGDPINAATQTVRQGHVHRARQAPSEALNHYRDAIARYQAAGYTVGVADTEMEMGQIHMSLSQWPAALQCAGKAKSIYTEMGHKEKEALCWMMVAQAHKGDNQLTKAMEAVNQAIEIFKSIDNALGQANAQAQLGYLHNTRKDYQAAEKAYEDALSLFVKGGDQEGEANLKANLGTLYYDTQRFDQAHKVYNEALALLRRMEHPLGIAGVLSNLSFLYEKQEKYDQAHACTDETAQIYHQLKMVPEAETAARRLKELDAKAGQSLADLRAELVPGLAGDPSASQGPAGKVGRNAPCPCGSGKKYKKCCGG